MRLPTVFAQDLLNVLLWDPSDPRRRVQVLRLMCLVKKEFSVSGLASDLFNYFRRIFGFVLLTWNRDGAQRKSRRIANTALRPEVTYGRVVLLPLLIIGLIHQIFRAIMGAIAQDTINRLKLGDLLRLTKEGLKSANKRSGTFPFLCVRFGVSQRVGIFIRIVSTFLFFKVLSAAVPIELRIRLVLFIRLRRRLQVAKVRTNFGTVLCRLMITTYLHVFIHMLTRATRYRRETRAGYNYQVNVSRNVAGRGPVFVICRGLFLAGSSTSCAVNDYKSVFAIGLSSVLIPIEARIISLVLVRPRIRLHAILGCDFVREERRRVIFVVRIKSQCRRRAIVFTYIAVCGYYAVVNSQPVHPRCLP